MKKAWQDSNLRPLAPIAKYLPSAMPSAGADGDAAIALMSLGFSRQESERGIVAARSQGAVTIEEIIAVALKNLAK